MPHLGRDPFTPVRGPLSSASAVRSGNPASADRAPGSDRTIHRPGSFASADRAPGSDRTIHRSGNPASADRAPSPETSRKQSARWGRLGRALALGLTLLVGTSIGQVGRVVANDSASELAAGGLVLVKNSAVAMEREDLTISPNEIRVRYRMRNDTGVPVQMRVAFPMPEVPRQTPAGMATATAYNVWMSPPTDPNFLNFRVWVDGQEVAPELELRAVLPDGRDVTNVIRQVGGVPLLLRPGTFELDGTQPAGNPGNLDAAARARLQAAGALELEDDLYDLRWTTHITFHWMQVFRPGVTVVEHSYQPIKGTHLFEVPVNAPLEQREKQRYCIDPPAERAIRSITRRQHLNAVTVGYILQTAKNWRGPIGTFHLTLEGEQVAQDSGAKSKVRLISLCTDLQLRQTGPMRFEGTMANYVPAYDLLVLLLTD